MNLNKNQYRVTRICSRDIFKYIKGTFGVDKLIIYKCSEALCYLIIWLSSKDAWVSKFVFNLDANYGKGLWNVTVTEYKNESTEELIANKRAQGIAKQNGYAYIDHWEAWPNATTKEILPYLQEEFGFPSAKGYEVWAQYVTDYFVAK
ncbi:hypothetical protein ABH957_002082 [Bacillus sp. RC242]